MNKLHFSVDSAHHPDISIPALRQLRLQGSGPARIVGPAAAISAHSRRIRRPSLASSRSIKVLAASGASVSNSKSVSLRFRLAFLAGPFRERTKVTEVGHSRSVQRGEHGFRWGMNMHGSKRGAGGPLPEGCPIHASTSRLGASGVGQHHVTANPLGCPPRLAASAAGPYLRYTVEWIKQLAIS